MVLVHGPLKLYKARELLLFFLSLFCWSFLCSGLLYRSFLYSGFFNSFFSLLGSSCACCARRLCRNGLLKNQGNLGLWIVVAGTVVQLTRAGVDTCTGFIRWSQ